MHEEVSVDEVFAKRAPKKTFTLIMPSLTIPLHSCVFDCVRMSTFNNFSRNEDMPLYFPGSMSSEGLIRRTL